MMADLIDCGSLFLPASRTGIMLLYKEELQFFEEHVIEGHINAEKYGILSYSSKAQKDSTIAIFV